jgi:uncharacterized membrane protein
MNKKTALAIILILSIAGILFSGYLSYSEIVKKFCALGTCINVAGVPACVYGFFMYLIIFIISIMGIKSRGGNKDAN